MQKKLLTVLLVFTMILGLSTPSWGAQSGKSMKITIPAFSITVNGVKVNNTYSKYPFIVCNNITYFPMTYSGCRFLGLENYWRGNKEGLTIDSTGITAAYLPYRTTAKNAESDNASIPSFPIKVNGKEINNKKQQYPLLSYRNITYFPMTWDFAVKEFGWDYSFNLKDGLSINSDNIKLEQVPISGQMARDRSGKISENAAVTDQYVYYESTEGRIIQAPLADPSKMKMVYQLPIWNYGDGGYVCSELSNDGGKVYLSYHQGGATMGSDYRIRMNDDGTATELQNSYNRIRIFGDKSFSYYTGGAPGPGNLFMKTGNGEYKPIGSSDFLYGWAWTSNENSSGGSGSDDVYLIGDDLYILAFDMKSKTGTTGIYKVNIKTNTTTRLSSKQAFAFQLEGDFLYYQNDGTLYRISIKDEKEELIKPLLSLPNSISNLKILNGKAYWQDGLNYNLYNQDGKNLNFGAGLDDMKIMGEKNEYLVCTFQETELSKYRIMVFDKSGNVVFKTSDKTYCKNIFIKENKIYYYNITTGTICIGKLPNHSSVN